MSTLKQQTASLLASLEPLFGEITVKGYFSYIGFYKNGLLIALGKNGRFALRVTPETKNEIRAAGGLPMEPGIMANTTQYFYWLPEQFLSLFNHAQHWFFDAMRYAAELKSRFDLGRRGNIRYLPNMNTKIERMLKKLGITTIQAFMSKTTIELFIDFIRKGIDVTDMLYLKLHGAAKRVYIDHYSSYQYEYLRNEGNHFLSSEGLRYRLRGFAL